MGRQAYGEKKTKEKNLKRKNNNKEEVPSAPRQVSHKDTYTTLDELWLRVVLC